MANTNYKLNQLKELHKQEEVIYAERNEKYGDSFSKTFQEYGKAVAMIRLEDKLNRAKNLVSKGLEGSDGESLIDTLKDLSNYANMAIIELISDPEKPQEKTQEPKKKRKKKSKAEKTVSEEKEVVKEKGPLDDLTKKQLIEIISQLGGSVPPKSNREKLISTINEFPKAKVAVAITSLKSSVETTVKETEDGEEE
jgi:hypothetical protein